MLLSVMAKSMRACALLGSEAASASRMAAELRKRSTPAALSPNSTSATPILR
jgi:hypothetical protein